MTYPVRNRTEENLLQCCTWKTSHPEMTSQFPTKLGALMISCRVFRISSPGWEQGVVSLGKTLYSRYPPKCINGYRQLKAGVNMSRREI